MAARAASVGAVSKAASTAASIRRLLVGEDPEDGALGDPGGLGDLAGGEAGALRQQQGHGGGDDGGPALLERQGRRPHPSLDLGHPGPS